MHLTADIFLYVGFPTIHADIMLEAYLKQKIK